MATRQRTRPRQDDAHEQEDDLLAYETMFDLDNDITEEDVEEFLEEQEAEEELKEKKPGFLNLQTGSGLVVIVIGMIYLMQQVGFFPLGFALGGLVAFLPWLAGTLIILTGFGVLSWSPTRRRRKARQKARERRARRERQRKTTAGRRVQQTASRAFDVAKRSARKAAREAERASSRVASVSRVASRASQRRSHARKRLAKSRKNKKIAGVAAGIANYLGVDATLVRIAFVIGTIAFQGAGILLYLILSFVLPAAEAMDDDDDDDDDNSFIRIVKD